MFVTGEREVIGSPVKEGSLRSLTHCLPRIATKLVTEFDYQKMNFVLSFECCCCEQPISSQKIFLLQFHWMPTTTTFET